LSGPAAGGIEKMRNIFFQKTKSSGLSGYEARRLEAINGLPLKTLCLVKETALVVYYHSLL